jgi:hypothetical protein
MELNKDKYCEICCEHYTNVRRIKLTCPCGAKICKKCVQFFLVNEDKEPQCMVCKEPYDRRFISDNLDPTFLKGALRQHAKKLIVDGEMSKMLDTQQHVQVYLDQKKLNDAYALIVKERDDAIKAIKKLADEKALSLNKTKKDVKKDRVAFKYPCPMEDCRGFVSVKGNCGTCECKVCTTCNQVKQADHECNPDDTASFELIKKETKPCPKCSERIQKISGCDQMWCTAEKVKGQPCGCTFSWKSGEIETGNVHNPHFFQWAQRNGEQVRNPGDIVCGGILNYQIFNARMNSNLELLTLKSKHVNFEKFASIRDFKKTNVTVKTVLTYFHRGIGDLGYFLPQLRRNARAAGDNLQLRIQYSVKEITKEQFERTLMRKHVEKEKSCELLKVLELYNTVGIEQLNSLRDNCSTGHILKMCDTVFNLVDYINEELVKVNKAYSGKAYQISDRFIVRR